MWVSVAQGGVLVFLCAVWSVIALQFAPGTGMWVCGRDFVGFLIIAALEMSRGCNNKLGGKRGGRSVTAGPVIKKEGSVERRAARRWTIA